jgi:hypothetical protein
VHAILTCALAAPAPDADGPDTRTPTHRRFDALMTVIHRGTANPGAGPSTARAALLLTLRVVPDPADPDRLVPTGPATTVTGEHHLSVRQAAQVACTADITPLWHTGTGEPLALGRTARFASPGQWKALTVRDRHCTYPGCTVPPHWCDTHHLTWWSRGGPTDTTNMTLLCGRHHTLVHHKDLTATTTGGTPTWHL